MPWMFLLRHKPYRTIVFKYVNLRKHSTSGVTDVRVLQTVNGKEIIMEPTQKDYFDRLQKDWHRPRRVRSIT
ncbi:unnamed protein product [Anisakis simplex]|uniref:Transposase n=1 Tax=Anisakis simplex TaxID=6269 RepID=A0A0M3JQD7_ANISI|nr:unnamed protein product [Anisakis simplex]